MEVFLEDINREATEKINVVYGFADSPFGLCLIAKTEHGVCRADFVTKDKTETMLKFFKIWQPDKVAIDSEWAQRVMDAFVQSPHVIPDIHLRGTTLQLPVWKALLTIPFGHTVSYSDVARLVGRERAVRTVASTIGRNPVVLFVPCHRVLHGDGTIGGYLYGTEMKKQILEWEQRQ